MSAVGKVGAGMVLFVCGLVLTLIASLIGITVVLITMFGSVDEQSTTCRSFEESYNSDDARSLTVKGVRMSAEQLKNATMIVRTVVEKDLPARAAEVAIMTAIVESRLINVPYGYPGSTSLGLYQQIEAWGPREIRLNPAESTKMFLFGGRRGQPGLTDIVDWQTMPRGEAAQAVQRSAYPDAYAKYEDEAVKIVAALMTVDVIVDALKNCEDQPLTPIELFVQAAIARIGDESDPIDASAVRMVSGSADDADFSLPSTIQGFTKLVHQAPEGVTAELKSRSDILSGTAELERGDVLLYSDKPGETSVGDLSQLGVFTGIGGGNFTAGTLNILHAVSHPGAKCKDGESLDECVDRRSQLQSKIISGEADNAKLDVVMLQEVSQPQYKRLKELLPTYDFWPHEVPSARGLAIMWDKSVFSRFNGENPTGTIQTFDNAGDLSETPWVALQTSDGHVVSFMSIHSPNDQSGGSPLKRSYNANAYRGWASSQLYFDRTAVFAGDFNRTPNNSTEPCEDGYYRIITKPGEIRNAYDLVKGQPASRCPVRQPTDIDQIFVGSSDGSLVASGWQHMPASGVYAHASDHEPVVTAFSFGATDAEPNELGKYVGINAKGEVQLLSAKRKGLIGAYTLTVTSPELTADGEWVFPLAEGTYNISSPYGPRDFRGDDFHNGADYGTSGATPPLVAMHSGTVLRAQYDNAWGNYLLVETGIPVPGQSGNTYKYMYAHLSSFKVGLTIGQKLEAGNFVGNVGETGNSVGTHLHLNICTSLDCLTGDKAGTVNPALFLPSVGVEP